MQKKSDKTLLIVNNYLDVSHPALAHQSDISLALANNFKKVYILTGKINGVSIPFNTQVFTYKPKINFLPFMILKFLVLFLYIIFTKKINVVFSHMSSRHSAVMGPVLKICRKKHVLWYAHKSKPFTLSISYFFVDNLVSSTTGSCPIQGTKVLYIGQSIDESKFLVKNSTNSNIRNFVHIGRFDPSKNIDLIVSSFLELKKEYPEITLTIIGDPSDNKSLTYKAGLEANYSDCLSRGLISFKPSIKRDEVAKNLANYDSFVHAFRGSLDKTLLEATLVGIPVVTINTEYTNEFGHWCTINLNLNDLHKELRCLMQYPLINRIEEIDRRRNLVLNNHTFSIWLQKITDILNQD